MASLYRLVAGASWWLGVLSLIATVLTKLAKPRGIHRFGVISAHTMLIVAGVLFLCVVATRAMERGEAPKA